MAGGVTLYPFTYFTVCYSNDHKQPIIILILSTHEVEYPLKYFSKIKHNFLCFFIILLYMLSLLYFLKLFYFFIGSAFFFNLDPHSGHGIFINLESVEQT